MRYILSAILISALLVLAGCSSKENQDETELLVAAASSLTDTLSELKRAFEAEHPDIALTLNYGASGKLSQQILQGAPVDVFLSADQQWMDYLAAENKIVTDSRVDFAQNRLVLIANQNVSYSVNTLSELPSLPVEQMAIGDPDTVPAGNYAKQALSNSDVWGDLENAYVYTNNVQQVLTYIESGNTEIGIVYASDLKRSGLVNKLLTIDHKLHEPIRYPAAVTASSRSQKAAETFTQFLQTDQAQAIFQDHGFSG
ncbi:molybdate ABC transporter substrate-binding protein [Lentibacillus salinarum]|uniref:Molybdate ABC transporter substrate-binding protein n=1 Tax=Lentibacillus salinarum TaxID=446820 RepID=A0ABW3ZW91_9BACI